jgi:hypothetical protein
MKTYVQYDANGAIRALLIHKTGVDAELRMRSEPGTQFEEVEGLAIRDPRDIDEVRKIAERHRIKVPRRTVTAVKKAK